MGLTLAAFSLLPVLAEAGPRECSLDVRVQTDYQPPWVDYVDAAVLNKAHPSKGKSLWLGLTTSQLKTSVIASVQQHPTGNGGCLQAEVLVMLAMSKHDVSLAKELRGLSCLHREVAQHEQQHVDGNRSALAEMSPILQQELQREVHYIAATHRSASAFRARLSQYLNTQLSARVQAIWSEKARVHERIDSTEEYQRIIAACKDDAIKMEALLSSRGL